MARRRCPPQRRRFAEQRRGVQIDGRLFGEKPLHLRRVAGGAVEEGRDRRRPDKPADGCWARAALAHDDQHLGGVVVRRRQISRLVLRLDSSLLPKLGSGGAELGLAHGRRQRKILWLLLHLLLLRLRRRRRLAPLGFREADTLGRHDGGRRGGRGGGARVWEMERRLRILAPGAAM